MLNYQIDHSDLEDCLFLCMVVGKKGKKSAFFILQNLYTVKPVYKGHSREPENVVFISSCPLYTGYMHYSLMGKIGLSFIDNDLLYRGAL